MSKKGTKAKVKHGKKAQGKQGKNKKGQAREPRAGKSSKTKQASKLAKQSKGTGSRLDRVLRGKKKEISGLNYIFNF